MLFSGLLTIFFPKISEGLRGTQFNGVGAGALGLFSGFNIVALVLIFLLNEETRVSRPREERDTVRKLQFWKEERLLIQKSAGHEP